MKGKTKMCDVFPDDMGLDGNVELALVNMDLDDPVLEPGNFEYELLEGSPSIALDATKNLGLGTKEEDGGESSDIESDFAMEDY